MSYEQLRSDCADAISRICQAISGKEPDPWLVEMTVEKWSMQRSEGRKPGQEARGELVAKG